MTVKELIKKLEEFPQDLEVQICYEGVTDDFYIEVPEFNIAKVLLLTSLYNG